MLVIIFATFCICRSKTIDLYMLRKCITNADGDSSDTESLDARYDNVRIKEDKDKQMKDRINSKVDLKLQADLLSCDSKREIPRSSFTITKQLGSGNFGTVSKGELDGLDGTNSKTTVAIKATKGPTEGVELRDFLQEIKIMSYIDPHVNLVSMIGSCSSNLENQKELWLIIEFCPHGDLKDYLVKNKRKVLSGENVGTMNDKWLLYWAYDIAKGMEFLAKSNIMHGDLAARNLMLDDNLVQPGRLVAKVADFGLSKQLDYENYEKETRVYVPWKWMALEYLTSGYFTLTSDVWSFGIVVWEILSFGRVPYGHQTYDDVMNQLETGYRLPCPMDIQGVTTWFPEQLYHELAEQCFKEDPDKRANFAKVVEIIENELSNEEMQTYAEMDEKYQSTCCSNYLRFGKS